MFEGVFRFPSPNLIGIPGNPLRDPAHSEELERHWLRFLDDRSLSLPSAAQRFVESCKTRPDFVYEDAHAVIYVDGPPHDYPERQQRDADQTSCLEDYGWEVIRFHHEDDWQAIVDKHPHVFGASP